MLEMLITDNTVKHLTVYFTTVLIYLLKCISNVLAVVLFTIHLINYSIFFSNH